MDYEEALEWLRGKRSMCNIIMTMSEDNATANVAVAQADAAMTQQAYWIVKAYNDEIVK